MFVAFNKKFEGEEINEISRKGKLEELTGVSIFIWKKLTGFFSGNDDDLISEHEISVVGKYEYFNISCERYILSVWVRLDLMEVEFESILLEEKKGKGYGTRAHVNMVDVATKLGFKIISGTAIGGRSDPNRDWNGHITWGKFGYTMKDASHSEFLAEMKKKNKDKNCLQKLFNGTEDEADWKKDGINWEAVFDLSENSLNRRILKRYLNRRRG